MADTHRSMSTRRLEDVMFILDNGGTVHEAARRLGVQPASVLRLLARHNITVGVR